MDLANQMVNKNLPHNKKQNNKYLFDIFKLIKISVKKTTHVNFLTEPLKRRSTLRSINVLVYRWVRERYTCLDLTRVSPLVRLTIENFTVEQIL
jgi:hypothetical protein